jgi:hypothetical protein
MRVCLEKQPASASAFIITGYRAAFASLKFCLES